MGSEMGGQKGFRKIIRDEAMLVSLAVDSHICIGFSLNCNVGSCERPGVMGTRMVMR